MRKSFIKYLVCPFCKNEFNYEITKFEQDHIIDGYLLCLKCLKKYSIKDGVPVIIDEFLTDNKSVAVSHRFGYQWKKFYKLNTFYEEQFKRWISPLDYDDFKGKIVLDAGCGKGRHIYLASLWDAELVFGIDLSFQTALTAFNNTKELKNTAVLCADLNNLPFKDNFFDIIYSIGVIHHTPDPKTSFKNISRHLKKNGVILVWLYAKETNKFLITIINPIRNFLTSKINLKFVEILSFFITFFLFILLRLVYLPFNRVQFLKPFSKYLFYNSYFSFISNFPFKEIWCIVFDHLIPQISHYLSYNEIKRWYEEDSLDIISTNLVNGVGWSFCGIKKSTTKI